jgi:hypothetical protein
MELSSRFDSLVSRLLWTLGLCGGVVIGRTPGGVGLAAATSGTLPRVGVGLLLAKDVAVEARVAIEELEFDCVGL